MYLGTYTFRGDPDTLLQAYDRLRATFPPPARGLGEARLALLREAVG